MAFETKRLGPGSPLELKWSKGSSIQRSQTPLDPDDDWDSKEYATLSDIGEVGTDADGLTGFRNIIAKMMQVGTEADSRIDVKFIDEEDVEARVKVDVSFNEILEVGKVYVMHRAKLSGGLAVLGAKAMLTQALQGCVWE